MSMEKKTRKRNCKSNICGANKETQVCKKNTITDTIRYCLSHGDSG